MVMLGTKRPLHRRSNCQSSKARQSQHVASNARAIIGDPFSFREKSTQGIVEPNARVHDKLN